MPLAVPQFKDYGQKVDFDPGGNFLQGLETARNRKSQNLKDVYQELVNQGVPAELAIKQAEETRKATDFQHEENFLTEIRGGAPLKNFPQAPQLPARVRPPTQPTAQDLQGLELDDELGFGKPPTVPGQPLALPNQNVSSDLDSTLMMGDAVEKYNAANPPQRPAMNDAEIRDAAYRNKQYKVAEGLAPSTEKPVRGIMGYDAEGKGILIDPTTGEEIARPGFTRPEKPTRGIIGYDAEGNGILIDPETGREIAKLGVTRQGIKAPALVKKNFEQALNDLEQTFRVADELENHRGVSGLTGPESRSTTDVLQSTVDAEAVRVRLLARSTFATLLEIKAGGGTLGAVSERELDLLNTSAAGLTRGQSKEQFAKNLQAYKEQLKKSIKRLEDAYAEQYKDGEGSGNQGGPQKGDTKLSPTGKTLTWNGTGWER